MPSEISAWKTITKKSKSLIFSQGTLCEKDPQTWTHFKLFSSSFVYSECMLRFGENNHNVHDVHGGYEEEMAPSSDVNDTDEDESKNSIVHEPFHKPSSENIYMDVNKSECNILNKTLIAEQFVRRTD